MECITVIPVLGRLRKEGYEFQSSMDYITRLYLKTPPKRKKENETAETMLLFTFLPFLLLWFGIACPFMVLFCFHYLCAEFFGESFVVVA
jgi:nucleoside recognition membrane protein YjiH